MNCLWICLILNRSTCWQIFWKMFNVVRPSADYRLPSLSFTWSTRFKYLYLHFVVCAWMKMQNKNPFPLSACDRIVQHFNIAGYKFWCTKRKIWKQNKTNEKKKRKKSFTKWKINRRLSFQKSWAISILKK